MQIYTVSCVRLFQCKFVLRYGSRTKMCYSIRNYVSQKLMDSNVGMNVSTQDETQVGGVQSVICSKIIKSAMFF